MGEYNPPVSLVLAFNQVLSLLSIPGFLNHIISEPQLLFEVFFFPHPMHGYAWVYD